MSKWTIILTNNSGSTVQIKDLGFKLADGETRTISNTFKYDDITTSANLKVAIQAGTVQVNDGVVDLGILDAIEYIFLENIYHTEETYVKKGDENAIHGILQGRSDPYQHPISAITDLTFLVTDVEYTYNKSVSGGYASLDSTGKVPITELPASAITSTFTVGSTGEQIALVAEEGDVAVRTDVSESWIHNGGIAGDMTDWWILGTPHDPAVATVQGEIGNVWLDAVDITSIGGDVQTDITSLSGAIDQNLIDVNLDTTFLSGAIDTNASDTVFLSGAIDTNITNISNNSTDVDALSGAIDGIIGNDVLQYWTESYDATYDMSVWSPLSGATDVGIVLDTIGQGAITSQVPDGTATGGNARGLRALDFQTKRVNADQVASGANSIILAGQNNKVAGASFIATGENHTISAIYSFIGTGNSADIIAGDGSFIGIGALTTINSTGGWCFIGTASGSNITGTTGHSFIGAGRDCNLAGGYGAIVSGYNNDITGDIDGCFIGAGQDNVVSGEHSSIVSGRWNKVTGIYSVVCGGGGTTTALGNEATATHSAVVGGQNNVASGDYSIIGGGLDNLISAGRSYGYIGGGYNNNINLGTYGTIGGGYGHIAGHRATIGGGFTNTASGGGSTVAGGSSNTASGLYASVPGGYLNTASGDSSFAFGQRAVSTQLGQFAFSSGILTLNGDAQGSKFILRGRPTDTTPKILTTNNTTASTVNQIVVQDGQAISFIGTVTAKQDASTNLASWKVEGVIVREGTTTTLVAHTKTVISNVPGWTLDITADDTNEALQFTFTGTGTVIVAVVANIDTSEAIA